VCGGKKKEEAGRRGRSRVRRRKEEEEAHVAMRRYEILVACLPGFQKQCSLSRVHQIRLHEKESENDWHQNTAPLLQITQNR
jgi:hypothetical protein